MTTSRQRLERFANESLAAYETIRRSQTDTESALKAIAEAIMWVCSLDEHHGRLNSRYEALRDADSDGALMGGIRYARNRALHQYAEILDISGGAALPMSLSAPLWEYSWRATSLLPAPDPRHNSPHHQKMEVIYKASLEGTPARFALVRIQGFLARVP